tara:strand:+ start:538 stop:780 length:243 start_codon:yes stop_codon:yes gene_type:complete
MNMNDEVKEILIDLVNYYNAMGTSDDPGIEAFQNVVQRSSHALERYSKQAKQNSQTTKDVDPFASYDEFPDVVIKQENEW